MPELYTILETVEDAYDGATTVTCVFTAARSDNKDRKVNKDVVKSIAADIANAFKMKNSYRRVDYDCIETKTNGDRTIFHHIDLDNPLFGKAEKKTIEQIIEDINKQSNL